MKNVWQLQEAKNKFSNLVEKARHEGPQIVTKHGKESVVVISAEQYQEMCKPKSGLLDFMQSSPMAKVTLNMERDKSLARETEL